MKLSSATIPRTFLLLGSAAASLSWIVAAEETVTTTTFVDDAGTTHEISSDATIVTGAMDAVAFSHFGLPADRILATFGERTASGSNYGGFYYDGNLVYGDELPHNGTYDEALFPADPDASERTYLDSIANDLSAECSSTNFYCDIVDLELLNEKGWPDMIVLGAFYDSLLTEQFLGNATENDVSIVVLKNSYDGDESEQTPRDMIEMIELMETLALALGATEDAVVVGNDKESFCAAAASFAETAQIAQDNGVRAMAAYMPYNGGNAEGLTGAFLPNVDYDPVLSMMQNLGMPILYNEHFGGYWEYQAGDYSAGAGVFSALNTSSLSGAAAYNVDFWLYDDRVSLDFLSEQFARDWPHPALVADQYAYWPSNGRILSYQHATEILSNVEAQLKNAQRVTPATPCTPFEGAMGTPRDFPPGEYSCSSLKPIPFCDAGDTGIGSEDSTLTTTGDASSTEEEEPAGKEPDVEDDSSPSSGIRMGMPWLAVYSMALLAWNLLVE